MEILKNSTEMLEKSITLCLSQRKNNLMHFVKIAYSKRNSSYMLFLQSEKLLSVREIKNAESSIKKAVPELASFKVFIEQPSDKLLSDKKLLEKTVKEYIIYKELSLTPFIKESKINLDSSGNISIIFSRELGPYFAKYFNLNQIIEDYFLYSFGKKVRVTGYTVDDSITKDIDVEVEVNVEDRVAESVKAETVPAQQVYRPKDNADSAKKPQRQRREPVEHSITKLIDLAAEQEVTVEGEVMTLETKEIKDGKSVILNFSITDLTSSISCQKFIMKKNGAFEMPCEEGNNVRVTGTYSYNNYLKEYVFSAKTIKVIPNRPKRQDNAPEKRVELHLHTNMSSGDGISDISAYMSQAAKWGHKALALTDHGVVQAFPAAAVAAAKNKMKIIFGCEAYMVDDSRKIYTGGNHTYDEEFVVFDIETTGLSVDFCQIIEIGAVKIKDGQVTDRFQSFVKPTVAIPYDITQLTGINDDMVSDADDVNTVLKAFWEFVGEDTLIAHNAEFDIKFIRKYSERAGIVKNNDLLDTLALSRAHITDMRSRTLDKLAKRYKVPLVHHRAVNDAEATAKIFYCMIDEIKEKGFSTFEDFNYLTDTTGMVKSATRPNHIIILCKNNTGLVNLYKIVSMGHLDYFKGRPRVPKSELIKHREGLIFGSACEQGDLYQAILHGENEDDIRRIAEFYDYLEIQPLGNNEFMVRNGMVKDRDALIDINKYIVELGDRLNKRVCATGDCHFLNPEDEYFRRIIMETGGFKDVEENSPLYFKTTDEMLEEFSYLGEDRAYEVVVKNTNEIADLIEDIELFPGSAEGKTIMPVVDGADEEIEGIAINKVKELYGDPIPEHISKRLFKELDNIIRNGFGVLYWSAMKLVWKSMSDGYLVGSRGSVGSSFAAFAMGITEVNPLKPHYRCPHCTYSDFNIDKKYACGPDMPPANCPKCGTAMISDGYDIPFEVFLGLNAEKVPDIDLNFSGEYRPRANKYVGELFGDEYVFRAGTISTIQDNQAIGLVKKYMELHERTIPNAELNRLAVGVTGVKKTTGQHAGGLVIVPRGHEIYEYTPIQKPADKEEVNTITTHFDFNSMHDILIKLDILGHDNPTIIRHLQDLTGLDPLTINVADEKVIELFLSTKSIGVNPEDMNGIELGVLGIPEFGTHNTMNVLKSTKPKTIAELIRISGVTHGTDVWAGNAETLIATGVTTLSNAICTRDDIMNTLVEYGVDHQEAFFIMESVRKGKWAKGKESKVDKYIEDMKKANVPQWFIDSCLKIQYMFPKAHAVAYVLMALRIAYFKIYYPKEFYAATYSIKAASFNADVILQGRTVIEEELKKIQALGKKATKTEKDTATVYELALEMLARGIKVVPPDLYESRAIKFTVAGDNVRMPFNTVPGLGEKVAYAIEEKRKDITFSSVEELVKECKLSSSIVDKLKSYGCLKGMPEKAQLSFFDAFGM